MKITRLSIFYILMHDTINTTLIMKTIKHVQVLEDEFYTQVLQEQFREEPQTDEIFKDH